MFDLEKISVEEAIEFGTFGNDKNVIFVKDINNIVTSVDKESGKDEYQFIMNDGTSKFTKDKSKRDIVVKRKVQYDAYIETMAKSIKHEKGLSEHLVKDVKRRFENHYDKSDKKFTDFIGDLNKEFEDIKFYIGETTEYFNKSVKSHDDKYSSSIEELKLSNNRTIDAINDRVDKAMIKIESLDIDSFTKKVEEFNTKVENLNKSQEQIDAVLAQIKTLLS